MGAPPRPTLQSALVSDPMSLLIYGLVSGCVYGLWAASFCLIYRASRIFNVLHAAAFTAAGYCYWLALPLVGAGVAAAWAIALAVAIGVSSERLLYQPLLRRGASAVLLFVASLGAYIVVENTIQLVWGAAPRSVPIPWESVLQTYISVPGGGISALELAEASIALTLWIGLVGFLGLTSVGTAIRAVSIAPELAELAGIEVAKIRAITFGVGSFLIGVAGVMTVIKVGIEPGSGLPAWVIAVVATLIGQASVVRSFVASLAIGFAENGMVIFFPAVWQAAVPVIILLLYLLVDSVKRWMRSLSERRAAQRNLADARVPV